MNPVGTMNKIFILLIGCLTSISVWSKDVVVLVPGFFNSFAPEYFSEEIVSSFKQKGFQVYVTSGLNPIGTIEDNGSRLEYFMQQIEKAEGEKVAFNLVGHSAGGLYSLWVADKQKFEIKNILTISTPYKGVEFIQTWLDRSILFKTLTDLARLESLTELTQTGVQQFISRIRINPKTKVIAFGGFQNESIDIWDARNISLPLRVTSHYISGKSDGVVGISSAVGIGGIKTTDETNALQFKELNFLIALDHFEQVLDFRSFMILGIRNPGYVRKEQSRFYSGLASFLLKEK